MYDSGTHFYLSSLCYKHNYYKYQEGRASRPIAIATLYEGGSMSP